MNSKLGTGSDFCFAAACSFKECLLSNLTIVADCSFIDLRHLFEHAPCDYVVSIFKVRHVKGEHVS